MMLKDKIIVILGGDGSIGSAIADLLDKDGAVVCRHGLTGEYTADVTDRKQTEDMVVGIINKFGRIDIVVNCLSAPLKIGGIEKKNWADFQDHLSVQLKAAIETAGLLIRDMKSRKSGQFINILSAVVIATPRALYPDYVTAKYAVLGFSRALNEETKGHGVFVNCVSPDFIKTKLTAHFPEKFAEIVATQNESGRLTTPEDVAAAVLDLINSPDSGGKNVVIVGGRVIQ